MTLRSRDEADMKPEDRTDTGTEDAVVRRVRQVYGDIASGRGSGCCGPTGCCSAGLGGLEPLVGVPAGADLGLGCGAPVALLEPQPGETILDLGSGAGVDCFLAATAVGPSGHVIGVDMTPEMVERARSLAARQGITNVEFRQGRLEQLPVEDASVDAVTSNCVVNLVPDKARVFTEIARVLRPGGRLVISDIVLDGTLPAAVEQSVHAYAGCIAGAEQRSTYFDRLAAAGLREIEILEDVPFPAETLSGEIGRLLDVAGVDVDAVRQRVRSVTYRATKLEPCPQRRPRR